MTMPDKRGASSVRAALGNRMRDTMFSLSPDHPEVSEVELSKIQPNPSQPRKSIDPEALAELASSIEQHGLLQPIVVQQLERSDKYVLVAGQRRLLAHQELGRDTIFAIVTKKGAPDELALIENLQRQDLDPLEEAEALAKLMAAHGYTQEQLGRVVGRKQNTISEILSLAALPDLIKDEYRAPDTRVSKTVLVELARVKDPEQQLALWRDVRQGGTLRQVRAKKVRGRSEAPSPPRPAAVLSSGRRFVRDLERLPTDALVTDHDRYRELLDLRRQLDTLIDRHVTEHGVPDEAPAPEYRAPDTPGEPER